MPENEIKLRVSVLGRLFRCLLYTFIPVLTFFNAERTPVVWLIMAILSVGAIYHWIALLANEGAVLINNEGIKYEGKMMRWETIVSFSTTTYRDNESGDHTQLSLQLSYSYLDVNINITRLNVDEVQIRELIARFSTKPEDKGHRDAG